MIQRMRQERGRPGNARRICLAALALLLLPAVSHAQDACRFWNIGATMVLLGDCVTTESIEIPDGVTLDGGFHTIRAADPPGGSFTGGVIVARGARASIVNTAIAGDNLRNVCLDGDDRLRGIYFDGASGEIRGNLLIDIRKRESACEEGTAIEVRNSWVADTPVTVTIESNAIDGYQKSGIVLHGHVEADVRDNVVGASAAQSFLAANSLQIGPGARAHVTGNTVSGNSHAQPNAAGTAILLLGSAPGTRIESNVIVGNADVGIHVMATGAIVAGNELYDEGPDGYWDVGIANLGASNAFSHNLVDGYRTRYHGIQDAEEGRSQIE